VLVCPACRGALYPKAESLACRVCGASYGENEQGYLEFLVRAGGAEEESDRLEAYAGHQEASAGRFEREFLGPYVAGEPGSRVLDAGCGAGRTVSLLRAGGREAYGVDLPKAARFWARRGEGTGHLFCADVTSLPFADGFFDVVMSLGVIEHVGTLVGHCTLAPDFGEQRRRYARELVRVTRTGGRILVSCPNKSFPVDVHHGPQDAVSRPSPVRSAVFGATGLNLHRTWGDYHLVSYREIRRLFCEQAGARGMRAIPVSGYFAYGSLGNRALGRLARVYVQRLPSSLRASPLNPFVLAEIRR